MKLALTEDSGCHDEICVGLAWSSASELFTCSDDQSIVKWQVCAAPLLSCQSLSDVTAGSPVPDHRRLSFTRATALLLPYIPLLVLLHNPRLVSLPYAPQRLYSRTYKITAGAPIQMADGRVAGSTGRSGRGFRRGRRRWRTPRSWHSSRGRTRTYSHESFPCHPPLSVVLEYRAMLTAAQGSN